MRDKSEMETSKTGLKEALKHVIPLLLVFIFGVFTLNAAHEGLEDKRYQDCVNHFNSTDFTNKTVKGNFVCLHNEELYVPQLSSLATGNPVADIVTAPVVLMNLVPWWIEISLLLLLAALVFYMAAVVGPAGGRI